MILGYLISGGIVVVMAVYVVVMMLNPKYPPSRSWWE